MSFPSEGRGHKFEILSGAPADQWLSGTGVASYPVATKFEKKASNDRFMQVPRVGGATAF